MFTLSCCRQSSSLNAVLWLTEDNSRDVFGFKVELLHNVVQRCRQKRALQNIIYDIYHTHCIILLYRNFQSSALKCLWQLL